MQTTARRQAKPAVRIAQLRHNAISANGHECVFVEIELKQARAGAQE